MEKKRIEDIKIKKRRIPNPTFHSKIDIKEVDYKNRPIYKKLSRSPKIKNNKKDYSIFIFVLFIITLLIGIVFWSSIIFENVNITITKKEQTFNLNGQTFFASKNSGKGIPFEVMIITDKENKKTSLSKSKKISLKAKGEITIYNEYSKNSQKIPINTYLSDKDGKVYLTNKAIKIPGYSLNKSKIIPGKATVDIVSFLPGEVYNEGSTNFHINAFKGTAKYNKIYGKSKTIISGGASGLYYSLSDIDKINLNKNIDSSLKNKLLKKVDSLIPSDYIFYPNASSFSLKIADDISSPVPDALVPVSGILSVILLKRNELSNIILKDLLPNVTKNKLNIISISGMDKLSFNFIESNQIINKTLKSVKFRLKGNVNLIWNPDISKIKNKLLGIPKDQLLSIFKNNISVKKAEVKIFPPWQSILPFNSSKIKIKILD